MKNIFINDLVWQVCQNEISNDAIVSEVGRTLRVLCNYGIQKINLRFLGKEAPKNQVCQISDFDVSTGVSSDANYAYYTTFNEIHDHCEAGNRAIKDSDISSYRFMLIDIDPERPSGVCATKEEKQSGITMADNILQWLQVNGITMEHIIVADSGNGIHLLIALNFLSSDKTKDKIKLVLNLLDQKFSNEHSKIDVTVYNPSRITRLYGTLNCKGDNTSDRPYRQSKLLYVPDKMSDGLTEENLNTLISKLKESLPNQETKTATKNGELTDEKPYILAKGEEWLRYYNLEYYSSKDDKYGNKLYPFKHCPLKDHSNNDSGACFTITRYGRCRFKCLHASCSDKTIIDFMDKYPCPDELLLLENVTSKELPNLDGLIDGKKYTYENYEISKSGIIKYNDKKREVISSNPFFISQCYLNTDTGYFQYELEYLFQGKKGTQKISASTLSPNKISDLTKFGILLASTPQKAIEYLNYQIKSAPVKNIHSFIGWKINHLNMLTFRLNKNYGDNESSILADNSFLKLSSKGTYSEWKQMVVNNVLGSDLEIALCVGFSSIILGYLAINYKPDIGSLIINFYGQSTSGKTTALHLINSIYSNPANTMYSFSATQNALLAILNGNMGVATTIDELSASRSTDLSELLYQIGQGQSRLRLNSDSTFKEQFKFNTVIATTSEVPMANYLNSNQGLHMRYIELTSENGWTKDAPTADQIKLRYSKCYGVASEYFMEKIFNHEKSVKYINEVYKTAYNDLVKKLPETRFKTRIGVLYATIYSSAFLIKELLDIDINTERVCDFLVSTEKRLLDKRDEIPTNLYTSLVEYTLSHAGLFHIKDSYTRTGNKIGVIKLYKETNRVFFFRDEFEKLLKKEFSISNIEKALQLLNMQNKLIKDKRRLVKYMTIEKNRIPMYCIELPLEWKQAAIELGIFGEE